MFDRIAPTYDGLNRLLSLRSDVRWRDCVARALAARGVRSVMDVATGTGDLLLALCRRLPSVRHAVGVDIAPEMLRIARMKIHRSGYPAEVVVADACALPASNGSFDAVTIAFGIRNVADTKRALSEMRRVLRARGTLAVLEFTLPRWAPLRHAYLLYFRYVLPAIGRLLSGDAGAYRYLNRTVEVFPHGERFSALLADAGFTDILVRELTFGVASLYLGRK